MIDQIKSQLSMVSMANRYGYFKGRQAARYRGGTNKYSLLIDEDSFCDFGKDVYGDVIDFYALINNITQMEAIHTLADEIGIKKPKSKNTLNDQANYYHTQLKDVHRDYVKSRGITDDTMNKLKIGYCEKDFLKYNGKDGAERQSLWKERITIPYMKNGSIVYMTARSFGEQEPKYKKMPSSAYTQNILWGYDSLTNKSTEIIIAEGCFDAMSCYQDGYKVLSALAGRMSNANVKELLSVLRAYKECTPVIVLDYDPVSKTGQEHAWRLGITLYRNNIDCKIVNLNGGEEKVDLSDLYAKGQSVESIISGAVPFTSLYIETASEHDMYILARSKSLLPYKPQIDQSHPELFKLLQKAPPEKMIVDELLRKYDLTYSESLGFIRYYEDKGVWIQLADTEIKGYISKQLGRFTKGTLLNTIFGLLKATAFNDGDFIANPDYINLENGMLNIKTKELIPHNKHFHSMTQVNYKYDPGMNPERWKTFIEEITDGDESRALMLQEMFGYCFTQSTKYQKMFFLLGHGANGKSVLLNLLEEVIGQNNVAHVDISKLTEPFQRAALYGKSVNMVRELSSRIESVNSILKSIVAGENIHAEYKFKAPFSFKPFCKIICAGNDMFTADDTTYGYRRRLIFCDFPRTFEGKDADMSLEEKLNKELSGIFSWSIEGLERLQANGCFTETVDQDEFMQEFACLSDNTNDFLMDFRPNEDWLSRTMLYENYKQYCTDTGTLKKGHKKFYRKVRIFVSSDNERYVDESKNGIRGFYYGSTRTIQVDFESLNK